MTAHREPTRDPLTGVQIRVGVMGSASEPADPAVAALCRRLGRAVAEHGACLLTGACPGLPHETVLGAKETGGHVVGISPAATLREHVETFGSPYREYDVLIFTGLGVMGRELINIRSSDIVVVIGGRSGTLGEFAIAYEEGKLIGVLTGTGGITEALRSVEASLRKDTGAEVVYEDEPARLIDRLLARYQSPSYVCPCQPERKRCIAVPFTFGGSDHAWTEDSDDGLAHDGRGDDGVCPDRSDHSRADEDDERRHEDNE